MMKNVLILGIVGLVAYYIGAKYPGMLARVGM